MTDAILVLNAGSSSLKFALFERRPDLPVMLRGSVAPLRDKPQLKVSAGSKPARETDLGAGPLSVAAALDIVVADLGDRGLLARTGIVGHRIVHGGRTFTEPTVLDKPTLNALADLVALAPLHQPHNLEIVELAARCLPEAIQVGCFDTAFHAGRPRRCTDSRAH